MVSGYTVIDINLSIVIINMKGGDTMSILNKDSYTATIKALVGDRTDDDALKAIEDLTDTFDGFSDGEDWKAKYEANDKEWREKYKSRFLDGPDEETKDEGKTTESDEKTEDDITIDDLFEDEDEVKKDA